MDEASVEGQPITLRLLGLTANSPDGFLAFAAFHTPAQSGNSIFLSSFFLSPYTVKNLGLLNWIMEAGFASIQTSVSHAKVNRSTATSLSLYP